MKPANTFTTVRKPFIGPQTTEIQKSPKNKNKNKKSLSQMNFIGKNVKGAAEYVVSGLGVNWFSAVDQNASWLTWNYSHFILYVKGIQLNNVFP